jgi:glucose-6-phosphate isomerase
MSERELWERYRKHLCVCESIGLTLDVSRMKLADDFLERMSDPMTRAFEAMDRLEKGAIANPDENRMVGHYWLRNADLAPDREIAYAIRNTLADVHQFARRVHDGELRPPKAARFTHLLVIGIGGSALGPQFVSDDLTSARDRMTIHFFDNTDPDGLDRILDQIGTALA